MTKEELMHKIKYSQTEFMRKILLMLLFACFVSSSVMAQALKQRGGSVEAVVPEGWIHTEAVGDMNKDGLPDMVVVATPNFKENMKEREDGYVYNLNDPQLAIYFGEPSGGFTLWKKYEGLLPANSEYISVDISLSITDRGVLRIGYSTFASMGSNEVGGPTYVYRWQNGDFFLIGKDVSSQSRYSGELIEVSENYLTFKRQEKHSGVFVDSDVKESEKWTKIPRTPLKRLGTFEMDE